MFDIGMTELLVIGIVALIVVGPKDLPGMFRTLGRFTGKMRGMAREFQRAMEDAADESGVKDIHRDLKGYANPKKYGLDKLDEAAGEFGKWDPEGAAAKPGAAGKGRAKAASAKPGAAATRGPETERLAESRRAEGARMRDEAEGARMRDEAEGARRRDEAEGAHPREAAGRAEAPAKGTGRAAGTPLSAGEPRE